MAPVAVAAAMAEVEGVVLAAVQADITARLAARTDMTLDGGDRAWLRDLVEELEPERQRAVVDALADLRRMILAADGPPEGGAPGRGITTG